LPPAFLDVGSAETFRDEVVDYASRIEQAGAGPSCTPTAAISQQARAARLNWLRRNMTD
jgi:acetyl esterase/lipase